MTIADKLNTLIQCKEDMKSAIESKGVTVTGGLSSYAEAISNIAKGDDDKKISAKSGTSFGGSTSNLTVHIYGVVNTWDEEEQKYYFPDIRYPMFKDYKGEKLTIIYNVPENGNYAISNIFSGANNLKEVSISSAVSFIGMFQNCTEMVTMPTGLYEISSTKANYSRMFYNCSSLKTISPLETKNATNMSYMFYNCQSLESLPLMDMGSCLNHDYLFYRCTNLEHIEGFPNKWCTLDLQYSPKLTTQSLLNIVNTLADNSIKDTPGYNEYESKWMEIKLHHEAYARVTDEIKQIAKNKYWRIVSI